MVLLRSKFVNRGGRRTWQQRKQLLLVPFVALATILNPLVKRKRGERLEINKFCKYCNQYTLHKETK